MGPTYVMLARKPTPHSHPQQLPTMSSFFFSIPRSLLRLFSLSLYHPCFLHRSFSPPFPSLPNNHCNIEPATTSTTVDCNTEPATNTTVSCNQAQIHRHCSSTITSFSL
ncbi:hypothetical protein BVC80_829g16 [Macleaya cordata]|uniref:Uncharacterized protein n=1 Tax=Macleaya cordata TaxID=56857 RepID=A0A200PZJ6_MACCD|nr:hypothetical protein BVC80_829g16 [Macleaya cordata]